MPAQIGKSACIYMPDHWHQGRLQLCYSNVSAGAEWQTFRGVYEAGPQLINLSADSRFKTSTALASTWC